MNKASNTYPVFSQAEMLAIEDDTRAPGQEARKITRSVSSARYEVKNYALASDIFAEDLANMDDAYRYELDTGRTRYLVSKLGLGFEKRILTLAANTTSVSTVFVVNSTWGTSGANGGDPIAAYWQAKEQMQATVAYAPNSILIGWRAHQRLQFSEALSRPGSSGPDRCHCARRDDPSRHPRSRPHSSTTPVSSGRRR